MMQQGLGALTPQLPAGQAPANPTRLAAAMDVVTSDAEEQILDPRTLALIKYKDAVQAMQSADQLMAASRPAPTPPTVAERTKLAAEQGIMGLASRLAPGLQQQGNRMGAAQMQQAMTGGLPQLPSPNMARMAGGGIVGYADGGGVDTDVQRYIEQYRTIMAAIQSAGTPEQKAVLQQRLREIQSTFDPETVARAHMQMSGQGMADGGAVRGFAAGMEVRPSSRELRVKELVDNGMSIEEANKIASSEYYLGIGEQIREDLAGIPSALGTILTTPNRMLESWQENIATPASAALRQTALGQVLEGVSPSLVGVRNEPEAGVSLPTVAAAPDVNVGIAANMPGGVARARTAAEQPKPSLTGNPELDAAIEAMRTESGTGIQRVGVEEDSGLEALLKRRFEDEFVDTAPADAETSAREAYAVPEELRELYRKRLEALDRPMYTPEEERRRSLQGLLSGLASSSYIAESGPAAMQGVNEVRDAVRQDELARAEQQFNLSDQLMGMDRTASIEAFGAGLEASNAAMTQQNAAMSATASMLNAAGQREQAALIQESQNRMATLQIQAEAISKAAQMGQDVTNSLVNYAETLRRSLQDTDSAMANILEASGAGVPLTEEAQTALQTLRNQRNMIGQQYNAVIGRAGAGLGVEAAGGASGSTAERFNADEFTVRQVTQ